MSKIEFFEEKLKQEIKWRSDSQAAIAMESMNLNCKWAIKIYPTKSEVLFSVGEIIALAMSLGLSLYVDTCLYGGRIIPRIVIFK